MKLPWSKEKRTSLGEIVAAARLSALQTGASEVGETAAVESVAGLLGRSLLCAQVEGDPAGMISPQWLQLCARDMIRRGEHASLITAKGMLPGASLYWDTENQGEHESTWTGTITTSGPGQSMTRRVPRDRLVICRWAIVSGRPQSGLSPAGFAPLAAKAAAESERSAGEEFSGPTGSFLPLPEGVDAARIDGLLSSIPEARGRMLAVHTTQGGFAEGRQQSPSKDMIAEKFHPSPTEGFVSAAADAFSRMVSALGASVSLFTDADGTAQREALRRFHLYTVIPILKLIEHELQQQINYNIRLKIDQYGADLQGRAAAIQKLVAAGVPLETALSSIGIE